MVYAVLCAYEGGEEEQNLCLTWPSIGGAGFRGCYVLIHLCLGCLHISIATKS